MKSHITESSAWRTHNGANRSTAPRARASNATFPNPGFVETLESPEIKMLRFPGLESPGKKHRSWKNLEKSWNSKVVVLKILLSGSNIDP